jgi:hypothetical protein
VAGERIVAFARPGKPRGRRFLAAKKAILRRRASRGRGLQRFLKLPSVRKIPCKILSRVKKCPLPGNARRASRCSRLRGSPSKAASRCVSAWSRYVFFGRENHGCRCKCAGWHGEARIFARRKDGADLQGDLATRQNIRRHVRQVKPDEPAPLAHKSPHDIGGATIFTNAGRLANWANHRSRFLNGGLLMPSTPNQRRA